MKFDMTIDGLNKFTRKLKELEKAVADLDGNLANLTFDPHDPHSIEQAIQQFHTAIDEKTTNYAHNEMVVKISDELKEMGTTRILERAAAARLEEVDEK